MEIFLLCELIGVFLVTLYLLNHYAAKDVSKPLKIFVFIPWFICFLMIGLAPIDIYYSYTTNGDELNTGFFSAPELLQNTWKALYWSSFVLSWVAIPLVQEYVNAGDFTHGDRIKRSLKINLIFYGVMGVLGLLFILYLVLSRKMGEDAILQFFITFSYCFGVFLIIVCLGFGLVHIPKRFLTKTSKPANLKYYQFKIAECREERISVKSKLDDLLKLVYLLSIRKDVDESQEALLNGILSHASEGLVLDAKGNITSVDHTKANEYDLTKDKMVALNKDVKRKIRELTRIEHRYQRTLEKAFLAEDVLESTSAEDWYERRSPDGPVLRSFGKFLNWNRYVWSTKLSSAFTLLAGIFCGAFSIFIFMVEIMSFVNANLVALNNAVGYNFMGTQVVCLIPLIYLAFCVYSSLFNMKLAGLYGLYPQQSDSGSLVFASLNFSRVAAPIVFNFLQIIKLTKTNFQIAMGDASIVISFAKYFPLLLLLLILAQLFDVYGRIMRWLGLTNFNFSDEYNEEKTEEGGLILVQARREKFGDLRERSPSKLMNSPDSPDNLRTKLLENSYDSETGLRRSSTVGGRSRLQTASQSNERLSRRSTGNWDTYTL